ncbi:Mono-/di-acylglycerol lipase, N-terminal, partial [Sesbania bispinosa]
QSRRPTPHISFSLQTPFPTCTFLRPPTSAAKHHCSAPSSKNSIAFSSSRVVAASRFRSAAAGWSRRRCSGKQLRSEASSQPVRQRRISQRLTQLLVTLLESIITLSETLRFTYSETLGKCPIGDLAFGINYFMRKQVNL